MVQKYTLPNIWCLYKQKVTSCITCSSKMYHNNTVSTNKFKSNLIKIYRTEILNLKCKNYYIML